MGERLNVLVVEDNLEFAENLVELLDGFGYAVDTVSSAEDALEQVNWRNYEGIITDVRLPGLDGIELVAELKQRGHPAPVVLLTGHVDATLIERASAAGAAVVLCKLGIEQWMYGVLTAFQRGNRDARALCKTSPEEEVTSIRVRQITAQDRTGTS